MTASRITRTLLLASILGVVACGGGGVDDPESAAETIPETIPEDAAGPVRADEADEADEAGGGSVDPCELLSAADLEAVFQSPFDDGETTHHEEIGTHQCVWSNLDAPPAKIVSLSTFDDASLAAADAPLDAAGMFASTLEFAGELAPLDLGDEAYLAGSSLYVLDGDTTYTITVTGSSELAIAGMQALAAQLLA